MALIFNDSLMANFTRIEFAGDFRIELPIITFGALDIQNFLGCDSNPQFYYAMLNASTPTFQTTDGRFDLPRTTPLEINTPYSDGVIERVGDTVTATLAGQSGTFTFVGTMSFSRWASQNATSWRMSTGGKFSGTSTFIDNGTVVARFNFDQPIGTLIVPESINNNNATIVDTAGTGGYDGADVSTNITPTSSAGIDQSNIVAGATVTLDGTGSSDSDGTIASYTWTQTAGATVTLSNASLASPTFTAPSTGSAQQLTFQLQVTDNEGATGFDSVNIDVLAQGASNSIPIADAGLNQSNISAGATVTLDGSGSNDADLDTLTYLWTPPAGITLSSNTAVNPTFTAPTSGSAQTLTFSLVVNDGTDSSTASTMTVGVLAEVVTLFTIVTQPSATQIFPRTSNTGGLYNKGQASAIFNATGTGVLEYRLVNEDQGTALGAWTLFTSGVDFSVNVPADTQWYKLAFREDGGSEVAFTNKFSCGGVTLFTGQSLAVRAVRATTGGTMESLGIIPTDFQSTYVELSPGSQGKSWRQASGTNNTANGAFLGVFLNEKVARESVCWALIGYTDEGEPIATFLPPSGIGYTKNAAIISEVGGFHEWIWFQGHSNSGTSYEVYRSDLQTLHDTQEIDNPLGSYSTVTLALTNLASGSWGTVETNARLRRAHHDFNVSNGGAFVNAMDIEMAGDGFHQGQLGNISLGRNIIRSQYTSSVGASLIGFTRAGANITVQLRLKGDSTSLVGVGNPIDVVSVSLVSNPFVLLPITTVTVNTTTLDLVMATDPNTDALLIWFGSSKTNNGSTSIRDNFTADGFSVGRNVNRTIDYFEGEMIFNDVITTNSISVSGIPNGSHNLFLINPITQLIAYNGQASFNNGTADITLNASSGDVLKGYVDDGSTTNPVGGRVLKVV